MTVEKQFDTFARLLIAYDDRSADHPDKLELAADWRANPPVMLEIGPVLHPDDAVGNKMAALYSRALVRDFLDIHAVLESGRYSRQQLLDLAARAGSGFDRAMFAQALGAADQITDEAFSPYGTDGRTIARLRETFDQWRRELLSGG